MEIDNIVENKELVVVKQQTTKLVNMANDLVIATDEDLTKATDGLANVKNLGKIIKKRKEAITKPLTEALNSARDLFKPIEASHAEAERIIKGKMLAYGAAQEKARMEAAAKIAAKVEAGKLKPETAVKKIEALPQVQTSVAGKVGTIATRTVKKVRIDSLVTIDKTKLTTKDFVGFILDGLLVWNEPAVRAAALRGVQLPGVEVYEEKVIASSRI